MTIRVALCALALSVTFAAVAAAESPWKGAAWYVVADTIVGPFVWNGPYMSKDECEKALPANEEDADYSCEYFSERPSWDE
ncbi:MAG: hypothetical protein HOP13_11035 [Alphaproteobacteria bacterium]|nr:hypothetical protein [Alphaproteobacteria bacterium]